MNDHPTQPRSSVTVDLTGRTLGDYVLIRRLGRGGMADVYLADQKSLDRQVALKVLKPDLAQDQQYVQRFQNEARAAAALVQANIVQIYEVGKIDKVHFIAQEYVRGQNLKQYLNRFGAVEPIMAVSVLRQVASALQKASDQGIIHRDIKPENIMLAPNGEVKVTDFGLARVNNESMKKDLTQIGITMGTPLYMSPEQVEGHKVDPRSDIYSLGVTCYHMLAGQPPFDGENALAIAVQHVKHEAEPIQSLRPDIPAELATIIGKMIAKKPSDRFQSATELLKDIRKLDIDYEDWDRLVEQLAENDVGPKSEARTVEQSRHAITRQLETVMLGHLTPLWKQPSFWASIVLAFVLALVGGGWIANLQPATGLFDRKPSTFLVEKKETVQEQYRYAFQLDTIEAYRSVINYFPAEASARNLLYSGFAKERMGEFYLREDKRLEAMDVYKELESMPNTETRFRLVGLMGQKIVYDRRGDVDSASNLTAQITSLKNELDDQELRVIEQNFSNMGGRRTIRPYP